MIAVKASSVGSRGGGGMIVLASIGQQLQVLTGPLTGAFVVLRCSRRTLGCMHPYITTLALRDLKQKINLCKRKIHYNSSGTPAHTTHTPLRGKLWRSLISQSRNLGKIVATKVTRNRMKTDACIRAVHTRHAYSSIRWRRASGNTCIVPHVTRQLTSYKCAS